MGLSTLAGDEIDSGPIDVRPTPAAILATTVSAALRAAAAVVAGLALVSGAALVLWAVTPGDGSDSSVALRGGAVAFAAAHFLPVSFSGVAVTIKPLLLTGLMIAVIATSAGRARMVRGRLLEALHASVFVLFYAVGVDVASALLAPRGTVEPGLAAPLIVAAVGAVLALAFHPSAWRASWRDRAPGWLQIGLRAGVTALGSLLTIGAVVLLIGLVAAFPHVVRIAELTVRSPGDALGMALLCLALLPNAVLAAVGYVSGAGFAIGDAHFSPLAVHQADLPAVPLLAATPDHALSAGSWAILAGPVLAAVLAGIVIVRESEDRWTRLIGCGAAAVCVGLLCAALVGAAGGGVAGGPWASAGAPPLLTAGIAATVTPARYRFSSHGARSRGPFRTCMTLMTMCPCRAMRRRRSPPRIRRRVSRRSQRPTRTQPTLPKTRPTTPPRRPTMPPRSMQKTRSIQTARPSPRPKPPGIQPTGPKTRPRSRSMPLRPQSSRCRPEPRTPSYTTGRRPNRPRRATRRAPTTPPRTTRSGR